MRIPMNYIEHLPIYVFFCMISGLYLPLPTLIAIWVMVIARIMYSIGYAKESKARGPGGVLGFLGEFALLFMAFISAILFIQGFQVSSKAAATNDNVTA